MWNDIKKGNFKLKFHKEISSDLLFCKIFHCKGDWEMILNTVFDCTCMEWAPSATEQVILSLSLLQSVAAAKRVKYLLSVYLLPWYIFPGTLADPASHLFLVLGCHTVASFKNLENGRRKGEHQVDNKSEQIQTSWLALQCLLIPYWLGKQNFI